MNKILVSIILFGLFVAACAPTTTAVPATPTNFAPVSATEKPSIPVTGVAVVQSVEIQIVETQPLQVNAILRGQLPDAGCTSIASVNQARDGNTFKISLTTTTDPLALCAQALTPFEKVVSLDVRNLPAAKYTVDVSGITKTFELLTRDLSKFKQEVVSALNARNFNHMRVLMDESFVVAASRSQGTRYTAEPAIEQLQLNHLSAAPAIVADPKKDLNTLLNNMDPLNIFGIDVGLNQGLFVSGWGLDGKDEAILFMNYLPDGSLYWHGVLVATGGFASSGNGTDTSVHETSVKYILALKDVTMYSGPGSSFGVVGQVASGQIAKVTGTNTNGSWWRVVCPDDSIGSCWISGDPALTQPTTVPHNDQPPPPGDAQPTTVQYVLTQQDVSIYSGPAAQYSVIGSIASGQTAKVTGVSADGNWWRVICPDDTVGSCWVTANTIYTQPAAAP